MYAFDPGERKAPRILRKGDSKLTLERVREQELVEASLADMAADIVSGEQQVALTSVDRSQLNSLLHMENGEAAPAQTSPEEAKPARPKRTSPRPGRRSPKRDAVGEETARTHSRRRNPLDFPRGTPMTAG